MSSKNNAKEAVLKYLKSQNRPYSANDITQNLHKEYGKTAIQKALDDLSQEEKIREKVYGKQKVYSAVQDDSGGGNPSTMDSDLTELDSKIVDLTSKLKLAEQELKQNEIELKDLENQPTTEEAVKEKNELESVVNKLSEKIDKLSQTTVKISPNDRDAIYKDNEKYMKEYRKRKRICMDIVNSILENYPKPKKTLLEEVGIEADEDVNCKLLSA